MICNVDHVRLHSACLEHSTRAMLIHLSFKEFAASKLVIEHVNYAGPKPALAANLVAVSHSCATRLQSA